MFEDYLNPEVQAFIFEKSKEPITKTAFQRNPFPNLEWSFLLQQIEGKQKVAQKLPFWFGKRNIIFPPKINLEQTSSEQTALYKSKIVSGETLIDLTGGFGIDAFYFAKKIKQVCHCEMNESLSELVAFNFNKLKIQNITFEKGDGLEFLKSKNALWDWIYIDPSRRSDLKGKVFLLSDCMPNVPELLSIYLKYSKNILIKTAPILDISAGIEQLKFIKKIHIVAVANEVKELLWEINAEYQGHITVETININNSRNDTFNFEWNGIQKSITYSLPKKYLYEPNAAIMKSNGFDAVASYYKIEKLHLHSHLYTSDEVIEFCGRIFEIKKCIPFKKNEIKMFLEGKKANITTRNFNETVENIRKKWKIKEGGDLYCFFTTNADNNKIILICNKIYKT